MLGDQADAAWPIYHDAKSHARGDQSDWTLCTALFDLSAKALTVYVGNPTLGRVAVHESLV